MCFKVVHWKGLRIAAWLVGCMLMAGLTGCSGGEQWLDDNLPENGISSSVEMEDAGSGDTEPEDTELERGEMESTEQESMTVSDGFLIVQQGSIFSDFDSEIMDALEKHLNLRLLDYMDNIVLVENLLDGKVIGVPVLVVKEQSSKTSFLGRKAIVAYAEQLPSQ